MRLQGEYARSSRRLRTAQQFTRRRIQFAHICLLTAFLRHLRKLRTPLSNIRITTFVCNETEVKIIDPNKLEVIEAVGCRIREVCI